MRARRRKTTSGDVASRLYAFPFVHSDQLFVLFSMIHVSKLFHRVCALSHLRTCSHRRTRRFPVSFSRVYTQRRALFPFLSLGRHNSPTTTTTTTTTTTRSRRIDDDDALDADTDVDVRRASSSSRGLERVRRRSKASSTANPRARGGGTTTRRRRRWVARDVDVSLANGGRAVDAYVASARDDARGGGFIVV